MTTTSTQSPAEELVEAANKLRDTIGRLRFAPPVTCVYNPLDYAGDCHRRYLRTYGNSPKRIVFVGMNPGPWGMVQTGVPFGEVSMVRDWLGIEAPVGHPKCEHPKRPVLGFACHRSEVSGKRLWGFFAKRFGEPTEFFREHFVANYCPLAFVEDSGRNRTPDKLRAEETTALYKACDAHLRRVIASLRPEWVIGVGAFAEKRAAEALEGMEIRHARIPHPSPASPAANRDWSGQVERRMVELGLW